MPVTTDPTVIGREIEALVSRAIRETVIEATANLIEATPVDTGWARANWIPAIGWARFGATSHGSHSSVAPAMAAQHSGLASMLSYRLARGPAWISNHVPYVGRLDGGWSNQAPAGFVRVALARAVQTIQARIAGWRP